MASRGLRLRPIHLVAVTAVALGAFEGLAVAAPTKDACIDANTKAQDQRRDGRLSAARRSLEICSDAACPGVVRSDCLKRRDELETAQPTIVFTAKNASGTDLVEVTVTVDGAPFADRLAGAAVPVDPGEHSFTFTAIGKPPLSKTIVIVEGQKGRREGIVFPSAELATAAARAAAPFTRSAPQTVAAPALAAPPTTAATTSTSGSGMRTAGFALGGVGVASIAAGAVFGAMSFSSWNAAKTACGTGCSPTDPAQDQKAAASRYATISTATFVAGGALTALGVGLIIAAPSRTEAPAPSAALGVVPGGVVLRGEF